MSVMIIEEYSTLLTQKQEAEGGLRDLPMGYLSRKTINGKPYHYLQRKVAGKVTSQYVKASEVAQLTQKLEKRKAYEQSIPAIYKRMGELEQAAQLLDPHLYRQLTAMLLSSGMDDLGADQKATSVSFAATMTAIEGVPMSDSVQRAVADWQEGTQHFYGLLESTLQSYGFRGWA